MAFESTRADVDPQVTTLHEAVTHARLACQLAPELAEAWATLGFVVERTGDRRTAAAALRRAVELEPDSSRHHLRLSYGTWGEERLRAARQTLTCAPGLPVAHWLAASVFIARNALDRAESDVDAGLAATPAHAHPGAIAAPLYWLKGLLCLARGATSDGLAALDRELAREGHGQLYAREYCAQVWYARGAAFHLNGDDESARAAFDEALARVPRHPMAMVGSAMVDLRRRGASAREGASHEWNVPTAGSSSPLPFEVHMARAALRVAVGDVEGAVDIAAAALDAAPPGNAGWLIPLDPLLRVQQTRAPWTRALAKLSARAGIWLPPQSG